MSNFSVYLTSKKFQLVTRHSGSSTCIIGTESFNSGQVQKLHGRSEAKCWQCVGFQLQHCRG